MSCSLLGAPCILMNPGAQSRPLAWILVMLPHLKSLWMWADGLLEQCTFACELLVRKVSTNTCLWLRVPGSWIQDLGSWAQHSGSRIPHPESRILDPGAWILDLGSRIQDPVFRILEAFVQYPGYWTQDPGHPCSWICLCSCLDGGTGQRSWICVEKCATRRHALFAHSQKR